jgi:peptidoglycan/xylan/chitin deacetylase (PgdA/CDA1 family)
MLALHHRCLLGAYVWGTMPLRAWRERQMRRRGACPIAVLFYHRVADRDPNDWTISVAAFKKQIDWLSRRFDFVSLEEAQSRIKSQSDRPCVSITFDDGYRDNCEHALPHLIERGIPCAYFVSWGHIAEGKPFPHDEARGRPLASNTVSELRDLAAAGVEIGGHTRTHADLGRVTDRKTLNDEVIVAGCELSQAIGKPVRYFAFPFGMPANLNRQAFRLLREAGYLGACSAYGGYNLPGDDSFHLQRIHADPEFTRFVNWMTFDPRKMRMVARFEYEADGDCKETR